MAHLTHEKLLDMMDEILYINPEAMMNTPNIQAMDILINQLAREDDPESFAFDDAVKMVMSIELNISQNFWDKNQARIEVQLVQLARTIEAVHDLMHEKFDISVDAFIDTMGKQFCYKLED